MDWYEIVKWTEPNLMNDFWTWFYSIDSTWVDSAPETMHPIRSFILFSGLLFVPLFLAEALDKYCSKLEQNKKQQDEQ